MRLLLLLAAVVGLALAEEPLEHPVAGEDGMAEVEVEVDDDGRFDAARLLRDLFNNEDDEAALATMDGDAEAEGRSKDETGAGQEDLSRYNNFVDTMFRRMNSQARTRNDPMSISLNSKKKPSGKTGKKGNKNKGKTGGDKKGKGKKGAKKGPKGDKKGDKTKRKNTRHPKDLSVDVAVGVEEEEEEEQVATMPEAGHVEARQKREVEEEQEQEQVDEADSAREARDMDLAEAAKETVETSRKNRPAGSPKAKKGPKKGKGKGKSKGKKGNKKNSKKQKKTKGGKRRTKKSIPKVRTSRANVVGIATLRRVGDVKVINRKDAKEIRSQFALGPVGLSVERKFGYGRDAVSRTARATSPELRGKMSILVSADGRARVSNFHIAKPSIVRVEGSLHKEVKTGADNNFMENSLNRITPFASKRLMASARSILATTTNRTS
ncbi:cylicin-2-like [Scylla paramamosain]|uniref:cylicin-2-like n=1 Tax=Scylla paramamosain TaxID=85552 RepID=UPI003082C237